MRIGIRMRASHFSGRFVVHRFYFLGATFSFWDLGRRTQFTLALRSTGVGTGVIRGHKWHIFFSIISKQNYLYFLGTAARLATFLVTLWRGTPKIMPHFSLFQIISDYLFSYLVTFVYLFLTVSFGKVFQRFVAAALSILQV